MAYCSARTTGKRMAAKTEILTEYRSERSKSTGLRSAEYSRMVWHSAPNLVPNLVEH